MPSSGHLDLHSHCLIETTLLTSVWGRLSSGGTLGCGQGWMFCMLRKQCRSWSDQYWKLRSLTLTWRLGAGLVAGWGGPVLRGGAGTCQVLCQCSLQSQGRYFSLEVPGWTLGRDWGGWVGSYTISSYWGAPWGSPFLHSKTEPGSP